MAATLSIVATGPGTTVQDAGRFGWLRFGVTPAGPMDWAALRTANLALGNSAGAAALEVGPGGIAVTVSEPLSLAFVGGAFRWTRQTRQDEQTLSEAARVLVRPGETLRARAGSSGSFTYLAVPGGIDVPPVMGSRATHTRSVLGGLDGRALLAGDRLAVGGVAILDDGLIEAPWTEPSDGPVRVVLGPQDDYFAAEAIAGFLQATWTLTGTADRMAYKFDGPQVPHSGDFNIVSDGIALGAVQIAGDGKPMVLMADRQPTGGYTKIAHVCRADIGRLAQLRPGETLRFSAVDADTARRALLALEDRVAAQGPRLAPLRRTPDTDRLFEANLIGGVTDGLG